MVPIRRPHTTWLHFEYIILIGLDVDDWYANFWTSDANLKRLHSKKATYQKEEDCEENALSVWTGTERWLRQQQQQQNLLTG